MTAPPLGPYRDCRDGLPRGRDYSTLSRQVAKRENLGLVDCRKSAADRRVRKAVVTDPGKAMTAHIDEAREGIGRSIFAEWDEQDVENLARLTQVC